MIGETPPEPAYAATLDAPRRSRAAWYAAAFAFVVGIATVILMLPMIDRWRTPKTAQPAGQAQTAAATVPTRIDPAVPLTLDGLASREVALDTRLDAIEARLTLADTASKAAAGNATRAERLLVAFAVRRELNRGQPLGPLEAQLHRNFDADEPQAVATIATAARSPVTLEDLRAGLDSLAPTLAAGTMQEGVWAAVKRELGNLVILRRESSPSPRAADRLTRTRRMLDAGNVEGAMAEVARLPGAGAATAWIDAAKRYVEARTALTRLEQSAMRPVPNAPPAAPPPAAAAPQPAI